MPSNQLYGQMLMQQSPETYQDQLDVQRRQALAKALTEQGMMPIDPIQSSGRYIVPLNPWTGINKIGQQLAGAYLSKKANKQEGDIASRQQAMVAGAISRAQSGNELSGQDMQILQVAAPEVLKSYTELKNAGPLAGAKAKAESEFRAPPAEVQEYEFAQKQGYKGSFDEFRLAKARAGTSGGQPFFNALPSDNGYLSFDARKGTASPLVVNGQLARPAQYDPATQGAVKRAEAAGTEVGKTEGGIQKRAVTAPITLNLLSEAEALLPKATGGLAGVARDKVAAAFSQSTEGAQATNRLKILAANLTLQIPRMEGPQSDRDTMLYKEAAANLGDPTVPVETRMAALQQLRTLTEQYAGGGAPAAHAADYSKMSDEELKRHLLGGP